MVPLNLARSCVKILLFLACILMSGNFKSAQSHDLNANALAKDFLKLRQNALPDAEVAHVKFLSGRRHKRDLSESDYHIIQLIRPAVNSTTDIHLHRQTDIVASHFKIVLKHGDEVTEIITGQETNTNCLYQGTIPSDPDGKVALSACNGQAGFSGLIMLSDEHWMIEPHPQMHPVHHSGHKHHHRALHVPHVIRRAKRSVDEENCKVLQVDPDVLAKSAADDKKKIAENNAKKTASASDDDDSSPQNNMMEIDDNEIADDSVHIQTLAKSKKKKTSSSKSSSSGKKTAELAVFTDSAMYAYMKTQHPKDTDAQMKAFVLTVVYAMDLLYEQKSLGTSLHFSLVHLEIQTKNPSAINNYGGDGEKYLKSFCDYAGQQNVDNKHYDHSLMLTGLDISGGGNKLVAGLAWAGTVCYRYYSCSVSEGQHFGVVYVITHEIGHSFGMMHDGDTYNSKCDKEKYIMSPTTGPGKLSWSSCSAQNIKDLLSRGNSDPRGPAKPLPDCLSVQGTKSINYASSALPGEKYGAAEQCRLETAGKRTPAISSQHPFNNPCSMLYCTDARGMAKGAHPALEGTKCAEGKKCRHGQCVK